MGCEQVCLKWNNFPLNITKSIDDLWKDESLVDVSLISDGQCLQAHKVILSASSPLFKSLFAVNPCQHPVIILQDVRFRELVSIMSFIYKGEVNVFEENLPSLLQAAKTLQIRGLSDSVDNDSLNRLYSQRADEVSRAARIRKKHNSSSESESNEQQQMSEVIIKEEPKSDIYPSDFLACMSEDETDGRKEISSGSMTEHTSQEILHTEVEPPEEIREETQLPEKSKALYEKVYKSFKRWCTTKEILEASEPVLLEYFQEQAPHKKASSLWATYSMLKATLAINDDLDLSKYTKLLAFLKSQNTSYTPKKSSIFSKEEVTRFLSQAPDEAFLSTKAILAVGLAGGCRTDELTNLYMKDVDIREDLVIINIPKSRSGSSRKFVIVEPLWVQVVKKYLSKRPSPDMPKVFIGFRNGEPTRQNIGHNTIGKVPKTVAKFLKLKDIDNFTGHSLRRTSNIIFP